MRGAYDACCSVLYGEVVDPCENGRDGGSSGGIVPRGLVCLTPMETLTVGLLGGRIPPREQEIPRSVSA